MHVYDSASKAFELAVWLAKQLHELSFPATLRNRAAASCFAVTQEHHHAIMLLLQQKPPLNASAFALVRVQFEAYVRGMWLSHCARDEEVEAFTTGVKPPSMPTLIEAIEKASGLDGKHLSRIYAKSWPGMCAYAHTGAQQVQRWNTSEAIEPNYEPAEVQEVIKFASTIALLSAVSVAALANDEPLAERILEESRLGASA